LRRSKPIRKKRPGTRRGQPTKAEKHELREFIYELSGGRCEIRLPGCKGTVLPKDGDVRYRWHLVHVRSKRVYGWPTEGAYRMRGGCFACHQELHTKGHGPVLGGI
jgi:hypothetical protein